MTASRPRLSAEDFLSRTWRGHGAVRSVFGGTLRTFEVSFRGAWSKAEKGYVLDETAVYDRGPTLTRSWHISVDPRGAMLGLEASQGGRMFIQNRSAGVVIHYDRLRFLPGPNVASLRLLVRAQPDGTVKARGWTWLFGLLPLFATDLTLAPD